MNSYQCSFACVLLLFGVGQAEPAWKAGVARETITPTESMWMAGYAARKGPSEEVMQDLHAKVLTLVDTEGYRMVIVTLDLIGVPKPLRVDLEAYVAEKHGLKPEQLLINASHTHCGPAIRLYRPDGGKGEPRVGYDRVPEDEQPLRVSQILAYNALLREKIQSAIEASIADAVQAMLSWHHARCGFAMNRRTRIDGNFKNFPNPDAPVDHQLPVLQIRTADDADQLLAVLFGYACHATTLAVMKINGDWPGYAQQYFEQDHPGAIAMFINGCSGDQNPYPRRMEYYVQRHGRSMATAIEAALETQPRRVNGPLRSALAWPEIPYQTPPTREELEERIATTTGYDQRWATFLLAELESTGSLPASYPVPVQLLTFGNSLTMIAIGGEVTIDYGLRLKHEIGERTGAPVWVAGYSNDVMGYIPSDRVLAEGGYEGATSMRYARSTIHPNTWAPGIEAKLVRTVHALLDDLR